MSTPANGLNISQAGVVSFNGTSTFTGSALTQHSVLIGGASNAITSSSVGATGTVLAGNTGADPTFQTLAASGAITSITGNSGGSEVPSSGNFNLLGTGSVTVAGSANTETVQLTGLTNHALQVGAGTTTLTQLGAGTTGQVLQTNTTADPTWSTSTYPSTNAINTLLYASAANVMAALATANSGVLSTSTSGVPSIDTTNFHVLTTGVQLKGNNTNTAPPAGFIGEVISNSASAVAVTSNNATTITSITLSAGIWDVSASANTFPTGGTGLGTAFICGISTTNNAQSGSVGIDYVQTNYASGAIALSLPPTRATLSGSTVYYLVCTSVYTATTSPTYGRIQATRVG